MLPRQGSIGDESYIDCFGVIDLPKDVDEFRIIGGTEILLSQRLINSGAPCRVAHLFGMTPQRNTLVVAPRATIDDPTDAGIALHRFPLGAGRADTDVVGAI